MFLFVILMMFIKSLLKKFKYYVKEKNVPFKNQTFTQVMKQIRTKKIDELKGRIKFSKEFKQLVVDKTKKKWALYISTQISGATLG